MDHTMFLPNTPFPNQFRADLRAGKRLIGCWASLAAPIAAEILGLAGFDWILLDGEHSPNDVTTFVAQLMALKGSPSAPVVRPPCNCDTHWKIIWIGCHSRIPRTPKGLPRACARQACWIAERLSSLEIDH